MTDDGSRARIDVGRIGRVDVEPGSRVSLVTAGAREHRLSLDRGTIHARIWAPPRFFFVNTPSAAAIDLGCAYTLKVDDSGGGLLRVTHGWVQFEYGGREAFIPQGAVGATRPGVGPGTPRYEDAPSGYADALEQLDFGTADEPSARRGAAIGPRRGAAARCADAVAPAVARRTGRTGPCLRAPRRAGAAAARAPRAKPSSPATARRSTPGGTVSRSKAPRSGVG